MVPISSAHDISDRTFLSSGFYAQVRRAVVFNLVAMVDLFRHDARMAAESHLWTLARKLQALAQTGLEFSTNEYDRERYELTSKIAAELMTEQCDIPVEKFQAMFDAQSGYATPKVDVRAAVFREGKILLVREAADNLWTMPGGWADVNDAPHEAAEREVREESGFRVKTVKLAAVYDRAKHPHVPPLPFHVYKMCFVCEILGGEPTVSREILEVGFFAPDALPPLSVSRILEFQIHRMFEHAKNLSLATDFD